MPVQADGPSIAVAMATYNGEQFLEAQLASLAAQTLPPAEVVVVDDGSTDGTRTILERFAAEVAFPVRIVAHEAPGGHGPAFFEALAACSADLVAFCDQDDVWHPEKLARCASAMATHPDAALLVHAGRVVDEALQPTPVCVPQIDRNEVITGARRFRLGPWWAHRGFAMVIPSWLRDVAPAEERPRAFRRVEERLMDHDEWVCFLAPAVGSIVLLADELASHRRHGGNFSVMEAPGRPVPGPLRRVRGNEADLVVLRPALGGDRGMAGLFDGDVKAAGYRALASQSREGAAYLTRVCGRGDGPERRARLYERAARILDARADAIDPEVSRGRRLLRVVVLALRGGYGRRARGGTGLTSLPLDLAVAVASRPAPPWDG